MIWSDIPGWFDWENIYDDWAERATDNSVIVEIGVWRGRSTAYLGTRLKELGKRPRFFGVDSWMTSEIPELKEHYAGRPGIAVFAEALDNLEKCGVEAKLIRKESVSAAPLLPEVDFCFIDGSHEYANVLSDLRAWSQKMKPGGQMAGHDLSPRWPGVRRAVQEFFGSEFETSGNCWVKNL